MYVLYVVGTCADYFSGVEKQEGHAGLRNPVDQAGELLGLVFCVLKRK
jgi:hypothetical protein